MNLMCYMNINSGFKFGMVDVEYWWVCFEYMLF